MKLTEDRIAKLECPAGRKDLLVFDEVQRGLAVRVSARSKTFLCQYTFAGAKRRVPLGDSTLAKARSAAAAILGDVAKGLDPVADRRRAALEAKRQAAQDALTVEKLLEQWSALRLAGKRESYATEAVRAIKFAFPKRLPLPAADLDRATVVKVLDDLTKAGKPAMASRTAAYGRACYQWALRRGSLTINPFVNLPLAPTVKRDRVMTDAELRAIWQATAGPGSFNLIVKLLMLTAQRRDEVAEMAWAELSADLSVWTIPASRAKNNQDSIIPLSPLAQTVIRDAPRFQKNPLVFPGERGPFSGWSKSKERLDKAMLKALREEDPNAKAIPGWTLHDLRRTCATGLQKLGVRLEVTEAVLNHVSGSRAGIVGIYQRHNWADEKRTALVAWGAHVEAIVEERKEGDKIVDINSRRAPAA